MNQLWVVDVNTEEVSKVAMPELGAGDPPHLIERRGDRLVTWNYDIHSFAAGAPQGSSRLLADDGWIFVPAADPDNVWVGFLDADHARGARPLGELQEIGPRGEVIKSVSAPLGGAWPHAEAADALLFPHEDEVVLWHPDTRETLVRIPRSRLGDLGPAHDDQLVSCLRGCGAIVLTDFPDLAQRQIAAHGDRTFLVWAASFSPDGRTLAVPLAPSPGGPPMLALLSLSSGDVSVIAGSQVPAGYVLTAWAADGETAFLTGGGTGSPHRIVAYTMGSEQARQLEVDVGDFYDVAAR